MQDRIYLLSIKLLMMEPIEWQLAVVEINEEVNTIIAILLFCIRLVRGLRISTNKLIERKNFYRDKRVGEK